MTSPWITTDKQGMYRRSDITGVFHTVDNVSENYRAGKLRHEDADYLVIWHFERTAGLRPVEAVRLTAKKPFDPVFADPFLKEVDAVLAREVELGGSDAGEVVRTFLKKAFEKTDQEQPFNLV